MTEREELKAFLADLAQALYVAMPILVLAGLMP